MRTLALLALALLAPLAARAGDLAAARLANWHQWRGPLANGVAPQATPPLRWDQSTNVKWKVQVPGEGKTTPIIWEDRVFLLSAVKTDRVDASVPKPEDQPKRPFGIKFPRNSYRFVVLCYDRATGKLRWERTATEAVPHEGHHHDNSFASSSPTTDGELLYASFGSHGVYCYDLEGTLRWKRDLGQMQTRKSFGEAASPVVHGDALVVNWDHEGDSFITALDARTGETRWRVPRDELSGWSTPLVVEEAGRTQVVVNGSNRVRSYDLDTGEIIWQCGGQVRNITPSPVAGEGLVFCMSGYTGSAVYAIPLDSTGDITDSDKIAWQQRRHAPYVPSPLLYGELLYFNKSNSGLLFSVDARSGESRIFGQRLSALRGMYASPVGADGRVYITGRDGATVVIKHAAEFEVLAENRLDDPIDASPAAAGDLLFLRSKQHLYCIQ